jgi:hypothetical protein
VITTEQVEKANDFLRDNAQLFAKARAERIYIEEFRKSKKALLVQEATGTVLERESYAYGHPEYIELLEGLREAVEREEELLWKFKAAQAKIEIWRTQESTRRAGV